MNLLSQTIFPRLWLLMQKAIGGLGCKHRIVREGYSVEKNILEIGCSVGNVSEAFRCLPDISFCGLDIDASAIAIARKCFVQHKNFNFICQPLSVFKKSALTRFDYILVARMLHHVDDDTTREILSDAADLLSPNGTILIYEPERSVGTDPALIKIFSRYCEAGKFLRTKTELEELVRSLGVRLL